MSDMLDRMVSLPRKRTNSEYLYGVPACHFANITYKGAIKEKIRLAKDLRKQIMIMLDEDNTLFKEPKEDEEYSEYQKVEMRLNSVENAIEFNEFLLKELDQCKRINICACKRVLKG